MNKIEVHLYFEAANGERLHVMARSAPGRLAAACLDVFDMAHARGAKCEPFELPGGWVLKAAGGRARASAEPPMKSWALSFEPMAPAPAAADLFAGA